MKYNRSLDFTARAILAMRKGKQELAAQYFTEAAAQADALDAVKIIEASNAKAFEALTAAKKPETKEVKAEAKATTAAAKRLKASDGVPAEEEELITDEAPAEESLTTDLSELDEVAATEEVAPEALTETDDEEELIEDEEEDTSESFAAVLASMQRRRAGKK